MSASAMVFRVLLAGALFGATGAPAWADEPASPPSAPASGPPAAIAAPPRTPDWAAYPLDVGVATLASAGILGLLAWDGGQGPIGRLGPIGQAAMVLAAVAVPPAVLTVVREDSFDGGAFLAGLPPGALGLGLGFALTRNLGQPTPGPTDLGLQLGAMAIGQGVGTALGYRLYDWYRGFATDLNRLPDTRTDDPIDNWNLRRERQQQR